ncbi:unnamed protein product [Heterosigma akashiwo]
MPKNPPQIPSYPASWTAITLSNIQLLFSGITQLPGQLYLGSKKYYLVSR